MRRPSRRNAFVLPAVLVLLLVLLLLAGTRHLFSRHHLAAVLRVSEGERVHHVAASALAIATELVDRALILVNRLQADPRLVPPEDLAPLVAALRPRGLPLPEEAVDLDLVHPLLDYLAETEGCDELVVRLRLSTPRPFPGLAGPLHLDPREHERTLQLRASAASGRGRATCVAFKTLRRTSLQLSALSKFALFLRGQGELPPNPVTSTGDPARPSDVPLELRSGPPLPAAHRPAPAEAGAILDGRGWVLLGGTRPWVLALGAPEDGDEGDGLACDRSFTWPLEEGSLLAGGGRLSYFARRHGLGDALVGAPWKEAFALLGSPARRRSLLRLCGTAAAPLPVTVLGKVRRRWALLQGLHVTARGLDAPLPHLDEASFRGETWPGSPSRETMDRIRAHFDGDFTRYAERMSDLVEEPLNRGLLELLDLGSAEADRRLLLDGPNPPSSLLPLPRSKRLSVAGAPALLHDELPCDGLRLSDESGRVLFEGNGLDRVARLDQLLPRARLVFDDAAELWASCLDEGGALRLDGIVVLRGDLVVDRPLHVPPGRGGMLVATGSVDCRRPVRAEDLLSLVALSGDLSLRDGLAVDAALVALAGEIRLPPRCTVRGAVLAGRLALSRGTPPERRSILWNQAFDPTDDRASAAALRVGDDGDWRCYVP